VCFSFNAFNTVYDVRFEYLLNKNKDSTSSHLLFLNFVHTNCLALIFFKAIGFVFNLEYAAILAAESMQCN
jgi:hypothetical protein